MNSATFSASASATTSMFPPIAADSSTSGGPRPCWPSCKPHDGTSPHVREHRLCLLARALAEPLGDLGLLHVSASLLPIASCPSIWRSLAIAAWLTHIPTEVAD